MFEIWQKLEEKF